MSSPAQTIGLGRAGLLMLALLFVQGVAAQTVYRCGADGRQYAQEPCGRAVQVADSRSAQQVAQAREVARREARLADEMERTRLQAEREAARQVAASLGSGVKSRRGTSACVDGADCPRGGRQRPDKRPVLKLHGATAGR